jgi:translation initiation factor IF-2
MAETKTLIEIPAFVTVRELATLMGVSPINVIKELMANGLMANINQQIDFETAAIVAGEMGYDVVAHQEAVVEAAEDETEKTGWRKVLADERVGDLQPRPPVVTMLGHVDHGKTSLLDIIRKANVTAGEAGGITQHIGAYQTVKDGRLVTFLDTPGHEAFTSMRARGAQATDIAILVVAADDGVMPQTREAVDHARAAHVPIVVALNKIDLPGARPDRVKQQLSEMGLVPDDWDGDTMVIPVSAREKLGIDDLLEAVLLVAEEVDPKANPAAPASGTVLEAKIERGKGIMTTALIQNGSLRLGDTMLVGEHYGRIKALYDYTGKRISEAGPSTPVAVSGLDGIPQAGEQFRVVDSEKTARRLIEEAREAARVAPTGRGRGPTLDEFFARLLEGEAKTLNLIVKADVQGSLEPIVTSLERLNGGEVDLEILRAATGAISEGDVMLASASGAIILGFNVEADPIARNAAAVEAVQIRTYSIIYKLIEDVEKAMKGMLAPTFEDVVIGRAEVRQVFRIRGVGNIAGAYMRTGEGRRNAKARVVRNSRLIHSGTISSLKHLQENVREVKSGFEFGVSLDGFEEFQPGDIIEFYVSQRVEV